MRHFGHVGIRGDVVLDGCRRKHTFRATSHVLSISRGHPCGQGQLSASRRRWETSDLLERKTRSGCRNFHSAGMPPTTASVVDFDSNLALDRRSSAPEAVASDAFVLTRVNASLVLSELPRSRVCCVPLSTSRKPLQSVRHQYVWEI